MDKLEKVRKEIERLKKCSEFAKLEYVDEGYTQNAFAEDCRILSFNKLLSFIDSMQEEPVSEELEKEMDAFFLKMAVHDNENIFEETYRNIASHFADWQKRQMMKDATNITVHIDAGNYPYIPQLELYDYDNDVALAKEGDKYKVVLIKEE